MVAATCRAGDLASPVQVQVGSMPLDVQLVGHSAQFYGDVDGDGTNNLLGVGPPVARSDRLPEAALRGSSLRFGRGGLWRIDSDDLGDEPGVDLVAGVVGTVEGHNPAAAVGRGELRVVDGEALAVDGCQGERLERAATHLAAEFGEGHGFGSLRGRRSVTGICATTTPAMVSGTVADSGRMTGAG